MSMVVMVVCGAGVVGCGSGGDMGMVMVVMMMTVVMGDGG